MQALRIRDVREDRGYKQEDIAKVLNISRAQYTKYENNYHEIPLSKMIILAKFYDLSIDYLCCLTDIKKNYEKSKVFYYDLKNKK